MSGAAVKDARGCWVPGASGNPAGKPKGAISKINRSIKDMILGALEDAGGRDYLARQAEQNPVAFMGLVGRVLPLQLANNGDQPLVIDFRWRDAEPETVTIDATVDTAPSADETTEETPPAITFISEC